jgi:ketosteroid isomerase-like protein
LYGAIFNAIVLLYIVLTIQTLRERRYSAMIGAIMAKKLGASGFDSLNKRDIAKIMASWAEDGTFTVPGDTSLSGDIKGKKAIEAFYTRVMQQLPKINFTVKEVFVSNIFAMGGTNNIAIECDIIETNRDGKEFPNSGVSIIRVKSGKVISARDYIFDPGILKEAWEEA